MITTKDYNYAKRALKKLGYSPKKLPAIIFVKALFYHILQKKSWRSVGKLVHTNHIVLYNFYRNYNDPKIFKKIFHYYIDSGVIVYIGQNGHSNKNTIDNTVQSKTLTKRKLDIIL